MQLYSLSLQKTQCVQLAIYGNFSERSAHEVIVSRGKILELLRPDGSDRLQTVVQEEVFGVIRSLRPFRLPGADRDHIVISSDSGRVVVLLFNPETNTFDKIHQETFGKTGCRRIVPGQYLATDPKGRAMMLGAVEKQKLVYVMNRDASARLTIQSPLEAHKARNICYDIVGCDVGFDNPVFACLEVDYSEADEDPSGEAAEETPKMLTYYELDLGINHVTRKWSEETDRGANMLIPVPGGKNGPGGVLVCCENWILYKDMDHPTVRTPIPRRTDMPDERGLLIVAHSTHTQTDMFFFLVQSELGDLYKVTLDYEGRKVKDLTIKYFDTVPVANAICIAKNGYLFVGSEFGNHYYYQFVSLGDDDSPEATAVKEDDESVICPDFTPRALRNLNQEDELTSLSPLMHLQVADLAKQDTPQLYAMCGRGTRSTMRILRQGLAMTELAVSGMPGNPRAVWTVPHSQEDPSTEYIVVSFLDATLVLGVGETVEEVTDSGISPKTPTLAVARLANNALLQVHKRGLRFIKTVGGEKVVTRWKPPGGKEIEHATANTRQLLIALEGGELVYFELDAAGQLAEMKKLSLGTGVVALDVGPVAKNKLRCDYVAVAGWDNGIRIFSLQPGAYLTQVSAVAVTNTTTSLCLADIAVRGAAQPTLLLHIGLANGVMQRTEVDRITGALSGHRTRFLGAKAVKLFRVQVASGTAVLALSSRSFLCYNFQGSFLTAPLSYDMLEHASTFLSEDIGEGIVAIAKDTLRILAVDQLGQMFNEAVVPLRYTPRKFIVHPETGNMIIIETDHNSFNPAEREAIRKAASAGDEAKAKADEDMDMDMDEDEGDESKGEVTAAQVGAPLPGEPGKWASCIRVFDPRTGETYDDVELDGNEAAFSLATVVFHDRGGEIFLVVGTAQDMTLHPRTLKRGNIHVYRFLDGKKLQLLHKTEVADVPYALIGFKGRLLAGVGRYLRIYDLGRRKVLKKCESRSMPTFVTSLHISGTRIYAGDLAESVHFFKYAAKERSLLHIADDVSPRYTTCVLPIDYDTVALADKFGNIAILRLPAEISEDLDNPSGDRLLWETDLLNGAPNKLTQICQFHVGEVVTSMQKTKMPGGLECIMYSTIMGSIGALLPFTARDDVDFFTRLEGQMRSAAPSLVGRDHLSYRSYYIPCKAVVDGDLCEKYARLSPAKQREVANEVERTPAEVMKKLEDIRARIV